MAVILQNSKFYKLGYSTLHKFISRPFFSKWQREAIFILIAFLIVVLNQLINWPLLQFWNIAGLESHRNRFNDLSIVLNAADCFVLYGNAVYLSESSCGNYLYGSTLLRIINFTNLNLFSVYILGIALALLYILTFTYVGRYQLVSRGFLPFLLIAFAPPFHLMVQRGHVDILMFFLVVLSTVLIRRQRYFVGLIIIFMSVLIKFYTAPLLILFLIMIRSLRYKILSVILFTISILLIRSDLELTPVKPLQDYRGRIWGLFGWESIIRRISETDTFEFSFTQVMILSFIVHAIIYSVVFFWFRKHTDIKLGISFRLNEEYSYLFLTLSVVAITCYFAGLNFDFRLIFSVGAGMALLATSEWRVDLSSKLVVILIGVSWLSFESGGLEILGDLFLACLVFLYVEILRTTFWSTFTNNLSRIYLKRV